MATAASGEQMRSARPGATTHREPNQAILVVGGGVAGIHAALGTAALGHRTILLEQDLAVGGHMAQLDKTFPTQDCSLCTLSPKLYELSRNPNIELIMGARVDAVTGCAGRFRVSITRAATFVDAEKCIGCGQCHDKCPVEVPDPFNLNMSPTKAIRSLYPQAVPTTHAIDPKHCLFFRTREKSKRGRGACRLCSKVCPTGAIDFEQASQQLTLDVGSIILAGGYTLLGSKSLVNPQWLNWPNVVTNLEMERLLSSTGPSRGNFWIPGTERIPREIVFIQCMGSRDPVHGVPYCSSVCCSASLKQASLLAAKPEVERITICYIDLRTHGRECESFLRRVQRIDKVHFLQGKIGEIRNESGSDLLRLKGSEDGRAFSLQAELVVLAMGIRPHGQAVRVAELIGVDLDRYGFVKTKTHHPVVTDIDGVYACGTLVSPKSIPTTVQEAGAAAFHASQRLLVRERHENGSRTPKPGAPESVDRDHFLPATPTPTEDLRIGVFVCRCGTNIAGILDTAELARQAGLAPDVAWSGDQLFTCSTDATATMAKTIRTQNLNRVVVASCSPRTHLPIFQEVAEKAGLSPSLVTMANIREQCAWVHPDDPETAHMKAAGLIGQAVDRVRYRTPVSRLTMQVKQKVLILGGGMAALTAAVHLGDAGISCVLVSREEQLGGRLRHAYYDPKRLDCKKLQRLFLHRVEKHPRVTVMTATNVQQVDGRCGQFRVELKRNGSHSEAPRFLNVGSILVAIGAETLKPKGLLGYGDGSQVLTQAELAASMVKKSIDFEKLRRIAMVQCVGSRNEERPYCSRSCCQQATVHALELKKRHPHLQITVLYRDLRTYGTAERLYQKAREHGIRFLRYQEDAQPQATLRRFGRSTYVDLSWPMGSTRAPTRLRADLLVLSTATIPNDWAPHVASVLRLPLTNEGFFLEKHVKLAPVETVIDGIFIAGQCHYPETLPEALVQGESAAAKILSLLRRQTLDKLALVAKINAGRCSRCLSCASICPVQAIEIPRQGGALRVDPMVCQGCGMCAAECPAGAIDVAGAEDMPLRDAVQAFSCSHGS